MKLHIDGLTIDFDEGEIRDIVFCAITTVVAHKVTKNDSWNARVTDELNDLASMIEGNQSLMRIAGRWMKDAYSESKHDPSWVLQRLKEFGDDS